MNVTASQSEVEYWLGDNDQDGDGLIDFREFACAMKPKQESLANHRKQEMLDAFATFAHPSHKGKVHKGALAQALAYYGPPGNVTEAEARDLIACLGSGDLLDYRALVDKLNVQSH